VYGSFLFLRHWPELERNVIRRFGRAIPHAEPFFRRSPHTGEPFLSKEAGAAPHDFGQPEEDPAFTLNSYVHQNSNRWKDLNCQCVLCVYRDVETLNDDDLLQDCWDAVKLALGYLRKHDQDGDGLIENDGSPDQTMDNLPMIGPSAYCGALWLNAVRAAVALAQRIGDVDFVTEWEPVAESARCAFDARLWAGDRYRYDADGPSADALFVDALFGEWFARHCGLGGALPDAQYRRHLQTVFEHNVEPYDQGRRGAVNVTGWNYPEPANAVESAFQTRGVQVREVLSGLNMSFALQLMDAGLHEEGMRVLEAVRRVIYREYGLWFRTPAAWTLHEQFRAIMNLRPMIIWALESA
jgi:non-lysosomal glucosylceramidase